MLDQGRSRVPMTRRLDGANGGKILVVGCLKGKKGRGREEFGKQSKQDFRDLIEFSFKIRL